MKLQPVIGVLLAGAFLATASPRVGLPQETDSAPEDKLGWHVVRSGETLEKITEFYLGTSKLWRENWKLNPELKDPNFLRIGQRLQVILERQLPPRAAEVTKVSNRVDQKPQPQPWVRAQVGSLLKERDGLRTFERSSAELRFDDESRLAITEQSLVFIRQMEATLTGVNRETVEIMEGQAELEAKLARPDASDIEIVMGKAIAKPRPGAAGVAKTRARRPVEGGAAVMVYTGRTEVAAGGSSVDVPTGMGTAVPEGGRPNPPEKLLPAPRALRPEAGSSWEFANPAFAWVEIDKAASYTVEVCLDFRCAELVDKASGLPGTTWIPERLPKGALYWRVNAESSSGLDGYPSQALPLSIDSDRLDVEPPVVVAVLKGTGVVDDGVILLGQDGQIELVYRDDASGVQDVRYRWSGGEWHSYESRGLTPPESEGDENFSLDVQATDYLGRDSTWSVEVKQDRLSPVPPKVEADSRRTPKR